MSSHTEVTVEVLEGLQAQGVTHLEVHGNK